jgi:hypothetical protein
MGDGLAERRIRVRQQSFSASSSPSLEVLLIDSQLLTGGIVKLSFDGVDGGRGKIGSVG